MAKLHQVTMELWGQQLDCHFTGDILEAVELVQVTTSSGDAIGDVLENLQDSIAVNALLASERKLVEYLSNTNYFGEAAEYQKEKAHGRY